MTTPFRVELADVRRSFRSGRGTLEVLRGVDMTLEAGDSVAILGPSGSGKSTLLHILGTLDRPTSGSVRLGGRDPFTLSADALARFRNETLGFVFQSHHLLPQFTVLENVMLPGLAFPTRTSPASLRDRAEELVARVGLAERSDHRPAELSGGERQRVAVARALVHRPALLLCDEPTGSLDRETATTVADLLVELHRESSAILVVVTHSLELAERFGQRCEMRDGTCSAR